MSAPISEDRIKEIYESFQVSGRPLPELLASRGPLRGAEAQRLRGHFTSLSLHPADCDNFALVAALMTGRLDALKRLFDDEVKARGSHAKAVQAWNDYRDSPNQLPVFDMLQVGAFSELVNNGAIKQSYYDSLEWLISLGLSVEGEDVAGYTALQHSLTCTPLVHDFEWSSILLKASVDPIAALNRRNRYGSTCTHELMMTYNRPGEEDIRGQALEFVLARGANVDIPDNDGSTARRTATRCQLFMEIIEDFDEMFEQDGGCHFCRRGGTIGGGVEGTGKGVAVAPGMQGPVPADKNGIRANLRCGRCRGVMYCSRQCQRMDWLSHKSECRPFDEEAP